MLSSAKGRITSNTLEEPGALPLFQPKPITQMKGLTEGLVDNPHPGRGRFTEGAGWGVLAPLSPS